MRGSLLLQVFLQTVAQHGAERSVWVRLQLKPNNLTHLHQRQKTEEAGA